MTTTLQGDTARFEGGLREVGPGVYAWLAPNGGWGEANAGLVVGEGGSALVDTLWDQRLAREMLAAMAPRLEGAPIELVVNTHSDGDHWWGNAEAPADAEIVTSQASLEVMREEAGPGAMASQRRLARNVGRLPGRAGAMGRYVADMLAPFAFEDVTTRLPDRAFSGERVERAGGRELALIEVGPAHSAGDLMAHVPDARVVFTADILFLDTTPVMWVGPVENWLRALDLLLELDADTFVPGHGPVGGRAEVERLRDYWRWLDGEVRAHHAAGRSPLAATRAILGDPGFAPYRDWLCPERTVISVTTIHRALSGDGPIPATPIARMRLFDQVATLARALARS